MLDGSARNFSIEYSCHSSKEARWFLLSVTPGKAGELGKAWLVRELRGGPALRVIPAVLAERLTDLLGVLLLIAVGSLPFPAGAQGGAWPSRPIRLVIAYPPGGSTDIAGRLLAEALGRRLGQQVVVDNRAGAGGTLGAASVVRAEPDGYTLLLAASPEVSIAPITMRSNGLRRSTLPGSVRKMLAAINPPTIAVRGTPSFSSRSATSTPLSSGMIVAPAFAAWMSVGATSSSE